MDPGQFIVSLARCKVHNRNSNLAQFMRQRHPRRLGLNNDRLRLPELVLLKSLVLQVREIPAPLFRIQKYQVRGPTLLGIKNPPRRYGRVIRRLLLAESRIVTLYNVLKLRNLVLFPPLPPLLLDNRPLFRSRVLLPLGIPLGNRQGSPDPLQLLLIPVFRPAGFSRRHQCRELYNLPLVRIFRITLSLDHLCRQIAQRPTGHNNDNRPTGLEPLPGTRSIPLIGMVHGRVRKRLLL